MTILKEGVMAFIMNFVLLTWKTDAVLSVLICIDILLIFSFVRLLTYI